jgi:16S rRNA (adenine1518-N6/adenine1519-N6)-dimethyltransferase
MDLTRPSELKKLLEAHGLRLSKRFGQNFLVDRTHLLRVVETAAVGPDDSIFEIGPGVGTLTVELAQRARQVVCVELDRAILPALTDVVAPYPSVTVHQADALKLDLPTFLDAAWGEGQCGKVVANIPYNITSPLLVKLLETPGRFHSITLMVQKEVADRLKAKPDTENYGSLTVFVQFHAVVSVPYIVPRGAFFPPPKVDSAIVHLIPYETPPVSVRSRSAFLSVSRAAFGQRRKTLLNALTNAEALPFSREQVVAALTVANIDPQRRGETLALDEIAALSDALYNG